MSTDKIALEITTEKLNNGYNPVYLPLWTMLPKTKKYDEKIGQVNLQETTLIGDAVARKINAQDTEQKHANAMLAKKIFNKYFFGISYHESGFQDNSDLQLIADQILELNSMQFDKQFFAGDFDSSGNLLNNALWKSSDRNYILNSAKEISATFSLDDIKVIFDDLVEQSETYVGNIKKEIIVVGDIAKKLGKFVANTDITYLSAIKNAYLAEGKTINFRTLSKNLFSGLAGDDNNGILVLAPEKLTFNYAMLPAVDGQGYRDEKRYTWLNVAFSSNMTSCDMQGAIIKQLITYEA
jgi:hypothetical protein